VIAFEEEIDQWLASTPVKGGRPQIERKAKLPPRTRQLAESVHTSALNLVHSLEKLQNSILRVQEQQERRQKARRQQPA